MYVIIGSRPDAHTIPAYTNLYKLHLELTGEGEKGLCVCVCVLACDRETE